MLKLGISSNKASTKIIQETIPANFTYTSGIYDLNVSAQDTGPSGIDINADGTEIYVTGYTSDDTLVYTNVTHGNLSTGLYQAGRSISWGGGAFNPGGSRFSPAGNVIIVPALSGSYVHLYSLSTAWNLSTSVLQSSISVVSQEIYPRGVDYNNDGSHFIMGGSNRVIYVYEMSPHYSDTTPSYSAAKSLDCTPFCGQIDGLKYVDDGRGILITDSVNDKIHYVRLSEAYNPSSGINIPSYALDVSSVTENPTDAMLSRDGNFLYVVGYGNAKIHVFTCV